MRLVIKVGTSLIAPGGRIDTVRMRALVDQLDLVQARISDCQFRRDCFWHVAPRIEREALKRASDTGLRRRWPKSADAHLRTALFWQEGGGPASAF